MVTQEPTAGGFSVGECLDFGWTTFKARAGAFVVPALVLLVVYAVAQAIAARLKAAGFVLGALTSPLYWICCMSIARAGARGADPTVADAFRPFTTRPGDFVLVALALASGILLCGIGAVLTWFLFFFAPLLALEGRDFKRACVESKDLVLERRGDVLLLLVVIGLINAVGGLLFGLGLIVTTPITALAVTKAYELLTRGTALPATAYPAEPQPPVP